MDRWFTRPLCTISSVDQIKRSRAPQKPQRIGTQLNYFNEPLSLCSGSFTAHPRLRCRIRRPGHGRQHLRLFEHCSLFKNDESAEFPAKVCIFNLMFDIPTFQRP